MKTTRLALVLALAALAAAACNNTPGSSPADSALPTDAVESMPAVESPSDMLESPSDMLESPASS